LDDSDGFSAGLEVGQAIVSLHGVSSYQLHVVAAEQEAAAAICCPRYSRNVPLCVSARLESKSVKTGTLCVVAAPPTDAITVIITRPDFNAANRNVAVDQQQHRQHNVQVSVRDVGHLVRLR